MFLFSLVAYKNIIKIDNYKQSNVGSESLIHESHEGAWGIR